ncbi:unnamed protein product [Schistocephalus solidus]|uniref:FAR1 domain-containing protein n=1 Tax=Schistocephalus solidus TaxID=70667 RepID=A0A183TJU9_SCHSO|nr:unnamed protein product [Schistocephalus solidus]
MDPRLICPFEDICYWERGPSGLLFGIFSSKSNRLLKRISLVLRTENLITHHSGCKARINVNLKQGHLIVTSACQEHNHVTIPTAFNRDLATRDAQDYLDLVSTVKPSNYRIARELGLLYGSQSSYRRVRRMRAYARQRKRANCQLKGREPEKSDDNFRGPVQPENKGLKSEETGPTTIYGSLDQWHTEQSPDPITIMEASAFEDAISNPDTGRGDTSKPSSEVR